MKTHRPLPRSNRCQAGYALLMVVFLASVMLIAAVVAAPSILTEGRRQKEEELVWRGGQYVRAVRLYYRKYGRFPQSVEDLTKAKNQIRFLRQAYTDPMNAEDGSWRLIYVTPSGQIIGSLKRHSLLQMAAAQAQASAQPPGQPAGQQPGAPGGSGVQPGDQVAPGAPPGAPVTGGGPPGTSPPGQPSGQPATPESQPTDLNPQGPVFGGSIIGVGSKVKKASLRIYDGASNYREWEFIWDPTKDALAGGQTAGPVGAQPPQQQQQPQQQPNPMRP